MGCPYNAKIVFGIRISKEKYKELAKQMDDDETLNDDDYFEMSYNYDKGDNYYIELDNDYNYVDNCSYMEEISLSKIESANKKAESNFDKSKMLQQHFKKTDIKGLLICEYVG
jgi:hypothetical protein